jgi:hypothetical protein
MPSPIGHLIAGAAIGRAITPRRPSVVLSCAALAAASDLDLVVPHLHRMATHSIGAVVVVAIIAIAVTGKVTGARQGARQGARHRAMSGAWHPAWPLVVALVAAFASHLLLDWLAVDPTPPRGLQLWWPFSDGWYISGLDLFRGTARRHPFTAQSIWINATAIAQEVAILGPLAWLAFRFRP